MIEDTLNQLLTAIEQLTEQVNKLTLVMGQQQAPQVCALVDEQPKRKPRKKAESEVASAAPVAEPEVPAAVEADPQPAEEVPAVDPQPAPDPEPVAEVVPPVAEPAPEPEVTWDETLKVLRAVNAAKGRPAVIDILTKFGLDPAKGDTVPKLQPLNRNAEIKAFAEKLLAE